MRWFAAPGLVVLLAASVALGVSGCASLAGAAVSTEADYPTYADVNGLRDRADLIVEVLIGEAADEVLQPQEEGDGDADTGVSITFSMRRCSTCSAAMR